MESRGDGDPDQGCCVFSYSFPLPSSFSPHVGMYVSLCLQRHIYTIFYWGKSKVETSTKYPIIHLCTYHSTSRIINSWTVLFHLHSFPLFPPNFLDYFEPNLNHHVIHHKYFSMFIYISKVELTGIGVGSVCRVGGKGRNQG